MRINNFMMRWMIVLSNMLNSSHKCIAQKIFYYLKGLELTIHTVPRLRCVLLTCVT